MILIAFLNTNNPKNILNNIETLDGKYNYVIASSREEYSLASKSPIKVSKNNTEAYNTILGYSNSKNYTRTVIISDNIKVTDWNFIKEYINIQDTFNQDVSFYPYANPNVNMALGKLYNPVLKLKHQNLPLCDIVRVPMSDVVIIKNSDITFDVNFKHLYMEKFMLDHISKNKVYSFGLFFDIKDSYKYFETLSYQSSKKEDQDEIIKENMALKDKLISDVDIRKLIEYIKSIKSNVVEFKV